MMSIEVAMVIEDRVNRARAEYRAKLCARIDELAGLLREAPNQREALVGAQRLAHRIYGSAGTFGFAAVGDAARLIDQRLLGLLESKEAPSPELWSELDGLLNQVRAELR